ncbi:MAG: DoxX family membrane protein [Candidatus Paceibacterota bacterium]
MEIILLIGRIIFGGFFFMTGMMHFKNLKKLTGYASSKNVPAPTFSVIISGLLLFLGGLGIIFNTYLNVSLLLISIFLLLVTPKMHQFWKETDPNQKMIEMQQFLKNMALLGATLIIYSLSLGLSF